MPIFKGVATALVTPFTEAGEIDYASFADIIEYQIKEGVTALVVCGTTGESATLTVTERKELLSFAVEIADKRVPVIAGTGSNSTYRTVALSEDAASVGADGLLVVTPYYNKASRSGLIEHYTAVAEAVPLPIIVYNVPQRTGLGISPEVYHELLQIKNIVGIKEANGSVSSWAKTMSLCPDAELYSGNDADTLPMMALGGLGTISVVSNILPRMLSDMCRLFEKGETAKAAKIQIMLTPLIELLFCEVNPIPIKYAMSRLGFCDNILRLPLSPLSAYNAAKLEDCLSGFFANGEFEERI